MLVFDASGSMSAKGWGYGIPSNELIAQIHDRMPLILPARVYKRWLGTELDPHDLLVPFPQELMAIWPVSTRVNKPENDEPSLLDPAA